MAGTAARKRKSSRSSVYSDEKKAYYDRLLYKCQKDVHKQAKVCKAFEYQKLIRKATSSTNKTDRLQELKQLSLEPIVQECLRRLGILRLKPEGEMAELKPNQQQQPLTEEHPWTERILQHKKMMECMEKWNNEVTNYRRWCLRQEDTHFSSKSSEIDFSASQFVTLGGNDDDYYRPNEDDPTTTKPKKNRPGQRSRKAKALAIEAKKEGRVIEQSINWRPKTNKTRREADKESLPEPQMSPDELHPSWQARKNQTKGIVAFQGTKITFD